MQYRRLAFLYLFISIVGNVAQKYGSDFQDDDDDGDQRNNAKYPPKDQHQISNNDNRAENQRTPSSSNNDNDNRPKSGPTPLAISNECRADVRKFCVKDTSSSILPNLKVLRCFDDLENAVNLISEDCQHLIYKFKYNMTRDPRFDDAAIRQCSKHANLLQDCAKLIQTKGSGRLIPCLYELLDNITDSSCRFFINQMQAVVFTDWRLSEYFVKACETDINMLECGRLDDQNEALPHEQGAVVSCLSKNFFNLTNICRKEIFVLAEMQSDDYHLDRALYYACREDRERLCHKVQSGNGRVYRCLYDHKFNKIMSSACRKEIHRRQSLVVTDVRADKPLVRACYKEIREHSCSTELKSSDQPVSLVHLLLCLENALKKGYHIDDECVREMLVHRRMLMSDYLLSPEIVGNCQNEMNQHCSRLNLQGASASIENRGGKMIHCLLDAARKNPNFNQACLTSVKELVRAIDPGSDIRSDPLLETTCRPVADILCPGIKPGSSNIILCLLDHLKHPRMTEDCEDRLMEVAYFMARDWRLAPRFMSTCQNDLISRCALPKDWTMKMEINDVQIGIYLGCLYQHRQSLARECQSELKRLMYIRAQSIGLMPEIEQNCIQDLATCRNTETKGEEMKCLQQKYDKLEEPCKDAVRSYTKMTISDPSLDFLLMKACEPMIQAFCSNLVGGNENDLIHCLVRHKNDQTMDLRCRAGIDHHQITSIKDEAFISEQFRRKCSKEVTEHCTNKATKADVIQCLADLMLHDVLKREASLTNDCREELRFELLQRGENINFDPILYKACQSDVEKFCSNRSPGNAQIIDCLKENREELSKQCFYELKKREKADIVMPEYDYSLMSKCALVIQKFCSNERKQNILSCLRRHANEDAMPSTCRRILYHRLMVLNSDARFNKALIENCQSDITNYCQKEVAETDSDEKDYENDNNQPMDDDQKIIDRDMGGRIIQCLRTKYSETSMTLTSKCVAELVDVIQSSKLDVKLDVQLYRHCRKYFTSQCTGIDQEDCLKILYQHNQIDKDECKEQIKRIILEGKADVHVDRALAFACQADIFKYCNDVPIGDGKQLQCLLNIGKSVTSQCSTMLKRRQELWKSISDIEGVADLTEHIRRSNNSLYLFSIILLILCVMFMAGCACRPYMRYKRIRKYK